MNLNETLSRRRFLRQSFAFSALARLGSLSLLADPKLVGSSPGGSRLLMVGDWGYEDFGAQARVAKAMQDLKANTSRWLRETSSTFQWQEGYGAFSVSQSQRATVSQYIANQAEHHRTRSFEEEFAAILQKSGINYDPRYVFG